MRSWPRPQPALVVLVGLFAVEAGAGPADPVEVAVGQRTFRARVAGPAAGELVVRGGAVAWVVAALHPERVTSLLLEHLQARSQAPSGLSGSSAAARVETLELDSELPSRGRLGGVAVGSDGSIYVSNFSASVWRVSPEGTVTPLTRTIRGSSGNTVDRDGSLLQSSITEQRIVRITPDGEVSTFAKDPELEQPIGLTVGADGAVYVCSCTNDSIVRIGRDGAVSRFAESPLLDCPNGIALGPDRALYVASFNNTHVTRVDPSGEVSLLATLPGAGNAHLAWARGSLYVTQAADNRIYRIAPDGEAELFAGTGERSNDDGPALSAGLAVANGLAVGPDGATLYLNTLEGKWRGEEETRIVLRRVVGLPETSGR